MNTNGKKLGFGMMRLPKVNPNDEGSIDIELTKKMVDAFLERGFTYFDTAWMYCGENSERAVKEAITSRYPRENYTITSKLPSYMLKSAEDRDKIFNIQLEKTGAEYFDYYLLHDINNESIKTFRKYDCFTWIKEKKKEGSIKNIGFSFHAGAELLDQILTENPDFDVVQLQINYLDWESSAVQSRKCYEVAVKHNKPVIVMEPVKGGTLANVPQEAEDMFKRLQPQMSVSSWAIRFAAGLDNVKMVLSGMSNMEQLEDNMGYMDQFTPLNELEKEAVHKAVDIINSNIAIPCTGCEYCIVDCPMNIPIPKYFSLYNADLQEIKGKDWTAQGIYYDSLISTHGKASDCIKCGNCERMCPQHLKIRDLLEKVAEHFE